MPITMHNIGSIDSIANVIFLAADERFPTPHSSFLFHGVQWGFGQGAQLTWTQLQEVVRRFKGEETKMSSIISEHTSISADELEQLFHQGETKDPAFAQQKGIIQAIQELNMPPGAPFHALNFP